MKITNLIVAFLLCSMIQVSAQYKTVVYDYEKNFFNEGQELPYESYIMVSGLVPNAVELVDISIYKPGKTDETPFVNGYWKKINPNANSFNMPLNYKLRQNSEYDFVIKYYYKIAPEEKAELYNNLLVSLMGYVDQTATIDGNDIELSKSDKKVLASLNTIVTSGTGFYKNDLNFPFPGFSDIVAEQLKDLENFNLKDNKFYQFKSKKDSTFSKEEENYLFYEKRMIEVKKLIKSELLGYLNTIQYIIAENKVVENYKTEKGKFILPVNLGYGAIFNSGDLKDFNYGDSPYLGLSFPLGNSAIKNSFMANTSVSFGFYLDGFKDENGVEITGPFVDKPLFVGLGTRAFKLLRVNAGVTALQKSDTVNDLELNEIYFRPSININFELGLWLGLLK